MKVKLLGILMVFMIIAGCGDKTITLDHPDGSRTGVYDGEMEKDIPNGYGSFTARNPEGNSWTYTGEFVDGHFNGQGETKWDTGFYERGTYVDDILIPLDEDEYSDLYSNISNYIGNYIHFGGYVVYEPDYREDMTIVQMDCALNGVKNNTFVGLPKGIEVNQGEYYKFYGTVIDEFEYSGMQNQTFIAPYIQSDEFEQSTYKDIFKPAVKTIEVNETKENIYFDIELNSVEFAEDETRVNFTINNEKYKEINVNSNDFVVVQNSTQYTAQSNLEYKKFHIEILPEVSDTGVIVFPPMPQEDFDIHVEIYVGGEYVNHIFNVSVD